MELDRLNEGWLVTFYGSEGFQWRVYVAPHKMIDPQDPQHAIIVAKRDTEIASWHGPLQYEARVVHASVT